jgi:heme-degrading monooxygenase HmoA
MQGKYAVIFASTKFNANEEYQTLDAQLMDLAQVQDGFLGYESVANDNRSIFISYWETKEAIDQWRDNARHLYAKTRVGEWYERYLSQICFVESSHEWVIPL